MKAFMLTSASGLAAGLLIFVALVGGLVMMALGKDPVDREPVSFPCAEDDEAPDA